MSHRSDVDCEADAPVKTSSTAMFDPMLMV